MATAFTYSGTGLESAIQSGSGGIGTGSSITLEVDAVPTDLSQGDTVKVALGGASDWSGGSGETAYGDIGAAGANGGTNITLTSRGQEGTSAASWSEGDTVKVGVQGRQDVSRSEGNHWINGFDYWHGDVIDTQSTQPVFDDKIMLVPGYIPRTLTNPDLRIEVDTGGTESSSGSGEVNIVSYDSVGNLILSGSVDATTAGEKTISTSATVPAGFNLAGIRYTGWSTRPAFIGVSNGLDQTGRLYTGSNNLKFGSDHLYRSGAGTSVPDSIDLESLSSGTANQGTIALVWEL
jgi:hypothetical protein